MVELSHSNPITACGYNQTFGQVVTADDHGIVKVWDIETGRKTFEFSANVPVTCLRFDDSHRRLVLGCRDGVTRVFNHNNGGLLNELKPLKTGREVTVVYQLVIGQAKYFLSLGWDRRINLFPEHDKKHIIEQNANPYWHDDLKNGHKEDILAAAILNNNLLASASFDGEIIIWNLISGHTSQKINCREGKQKTTSNPFHIIETGGPFITTLACYRKILIAGHCNGNILLFNTLGTNKKLIRNLPLLFRPKSVPNEFNKSIRLLDFCPSNKFIIYKKFSR